MYGGCSQLGRHRLADAAKLKVSLGDLHQSAITLSLDKFGGDRKAFASSGYWLQNKLSGLGLRSLLYSSELCRRYVQPRRDAVVEAVG